MDNVREKVIGSIKDEMHKLIDGSISNIEATIVVIVVFGAGAVVGSIQMALTMMDYIYHNPEVMELFK